MKITDKHIIELVRNSEQVQQIWNSAKTKVPVASGDSELVIYDYIYDGVLDKVREFLAKSSGAVTVKINSWGGDVFSGFAIYNELSEYAKKEGNEITTKVMGMAASAAALIFMAGDKRYMKAQSMLMFHKSWNCVCGNADDLKKSAELLDSIDEMMGNLIESKLELDGSANDFLLAEKFLTLKDAAAIKAAEEDPNDDDKYEDNEDARDEEEKKGKSGVDTAGNQKLKRYGRRNDGVSCPKTESVNFKH